MQARRDTYLDAFKGMMILSVINIHTVYWSLKPYTPDITRELAYFVDIPIFFFISGYLMKHSSLKATSRQVFRQFTRLYVHYVIISFLVAAGIIIWAHISLDRSIEGLGSSLVDIFTLGLSGELWGYFKGYYGSLWYLHTYFPLLLLVPVLVGLPLFRRNRYPVLLCTIGLYFLMTYQYKGHEFLLRDWGDVLCYSFFFVLGTIFRIEEEHLSRGDIVFSLVLTSLIACLIFIMDGGELRLSAYKFPPAVQWVVYSLLLVHVFVLLKPHWSRSIRPRIAPVAGKLEWIGRNSFTMYLFQGLVCSIPFLFAASLHDYVSSALLLYLIVFSFNAAGSTLLTWFYSGAERIVKARFFDTGQKQQAPDSSPPSSAKRSPGN